MDRAFLLPVSPLVVPLRMWSLVSILLLLTVPSVDEKGSMRNTDQMGWNKISNMIKWLVIVIILFARF